MTWCLWAEHREGGLHDAVPEEWLGQGLCPEVCTEERG